MAVAASNPCWAAGTCANDYVFPASGSDEVHALGQAWEGGHHAVPGADIDVGHAAPARVGDRCVVDQPVQPAQRGNGLRRTALDGSGVRQVCHHGVHGKALAPQALGGCGQQVFTDIGQGHLGTCGTERLGKTQAQPPGSARDQNAPTRENLGCG